MKQDAIGLDIGGANIKAATASGKAISRPFELWKHPERLTASLESLASTIPTAGPVAVTMTGELCDCFPTKRDGVQQILAAVEQVFSENRIRVWSTAGHFLALDHAKEVPLAVAAANWHAQATYVARLLKRSADSQRIETGSKPVEDPLAPTALLVDTGSTTTDIIPMVAGRPVPLGLTDPDRLKSRELIYTGSRRTAICALVHTGIAAEVFATVQDAYLLLGMIEQDESDRGTADGRPATKPFAHARMARMLGGDPEITSMEETTQLARNLFRLQQSLIVEAMREVAGRLPNPPETIVVSGSGEFLARAAVDEFSQSAGSLRIEYLSDRLGKEISQAACAYSLARLAMEISL